MEWTDHSRYGSLRTYQLSGNQLSIICNDSPTYSYNTLPDSSYHMIDPEGGPYLCIGKKLPYENLIITRIVSCKLKRNTLTINLEVKQ